MAHAFAIIVPRRDPLVDPRISAKSQPEPLLSVVHRTLSLFALEIRLKHWYGKEREAVSYYAFAYLAKACKRGTELHDPGQIAIESRIPGGPLNAKKEVCKDPAIWSKSGENCWDEKHESTRYPLVVMEWKAGSDRFSTYDLRTPREPLRSGARHGGHSSDFRRWREAHATRDTC
ncbi:MAG: hypothetical protein IPJ76_18965 [Flavobacteriales bacterium]|nr:MAG: hypothetical protein IPJ76_18965 [Flavobacteriales bacterium]